MKLEKEVKISEIRRSPYYQPRLDDSFKITLENDNLSESEYEKLCKISKSRKIKLTLEVEEPILDEEERKYLSSVIRPFRDKVIYIKKQEVFSNTCFVEICVARFDMHSSEKIRLPEFGNEEMYKKMKLHKEYTLEELGL